MYGLGFCWPLLSIIQANGQAAMTWVILNASSTAFVGSGHCHYGRVGLKKRGGIVFVRWG